MTWVIIIILGLVVIFFISDKKHNKEVEQHHIKQGGFRKSFPTFINHLENFYAMTFVNDTGRSFTYSKQMNDTNGNRGLLIIGVKLDMRDKPIIFTKFQSKYKGEFLGIDVSGVNYTKVDSIDEGINISIDRIKTQGIINYQDKESQLTNHSASKQFIEEWNTIATSLAAKSFTDEDHIRKDDFEIYVNILFVPDSIDLQHFSENLKALPKEDVIYDRSFSRIPNNIEFGTQSAWKIYQCTFLFSKIFCAAYPDVYLWMEANAKHGGVETYLKLNNLSHSEHVELINDPVRICGWYRELVDEYKKLGNQLETKKA